MAIPAPLANGELFTLSNGQSLYYAIYGDSEATATIFFHHGLPGSRLEASILSEPARRHRLRIISVDRPGMGRSTFQPGYRLLDWPAMLLALTHHLQVDRFAVFGVSGGAPYAFACLHEIPKAQCVGGGILAGVYPPNLGWTGMVMPTRALFTVGAWTPWLVEKTLDYVLGALAKDVEHPEKLERFLEGTFDTRPECDRAVWDANTADIRPMLVQDSMEAMRSGCKGAAWETYLAANDWGFRLEDISASKAGQLVMWHGALDANWPAAMAQKAQKLMEGAELRISETDGHVSILANKVEEVVDAMAKILAQ